MQERLEIKMEIYPTKQLNQSLQSVGVGHEKGEGMEIDQDGLGSPLMPEVWNLPGHIYQMEQEGNGVERKPAL